MTNNQNHFEGCMVIEEPDVEIYVLSENYVISHSNYVQMSHSSKPSFLNNRVFYLNEDQKRIAVTTRELMYKFIEAETFFGGPCAGIQGKRRSRKRETSSNNSSMINEAPIEVIEITHSRPRSPKPIITLPDDRRRNQIDDSEVRQLQQESSKISLNPLLFFDPNDCRPEDSNRQSISKSSNQHGQEIHAQHNSRMNTFSQTTDFEIETEAVAGPEPHPGRSFNDDGSFLEEIPQHISENIAEDIIEEFDESENDSNSSIHHESEWIRYFFTDASFCENCKEYGHMTRRCTAPLKNACRFCLESHQGKWCKPICFICKTPGHLQNECKFAHMHKKGLSCPTCRKIGHVNDCRTLMSRFANPQLDEQSIKEVKCMSCHRYGHFNCDNVQ